MSREPKENPPVEMERMFGALLRIPFQAIVEEIQSGLYRAGFTDLRPGHFAVFRHLPTEGARLTQLARDAQITKQSMGEVVRQLEAQGYVERVPDPEDRRAQIVRRTDRGWEAELVARETIAELVDDWRRQLGEERFDQGVSFLSELAKVIEAARSEAHS